MDDQVTENTHLLSNGHGDSEAGITQTKGELFKDYAFIGERLPYNDYTSIDWLHDLV